MIYFFVIAAALVGAWAFENSRRKTHPVPEGYQPDIDLPYTDEFELYHNALSLCSMKSRVCLSELAIPYKSHHIDLIETGAYENIRDKLLSVNPGGTVPVLVHHGHPIYESHMQIRYAAEHAPAGSPALTPDDPGLRAEMEEWIDRSSLIGDPLKETDASAGNCIPGLTLPLFATMIVEIPFWNILEGLLFHFDRRRPSLFVVLKLAGMGRLGKLKPAMAVIAKSRRQMGMHLDALEEKLVKSGGPWILGEFFSLADVSWLVIFERLEQADFDDVFYGSKADPDGSALRPAVAAYWQSLRGRPSYADAIAGHSHPTIVNGTVLLKAAKAADATLRLALEGA